MSSNVLKALAVCSIIAAQQSAVAEVPEAFIETPRALAFGAPPTIGDPILAPNGTRMLFLQQNQQGVAMLSSMNLANGEIETLLEGTTQGYDIRSCEFANETRVLCDLQRRAPPSQSDDYHRFVAVNLDGTERLEMAGGSGCRRYDALRDGLRIDRLPDDREQVMFLCGGTASLLDIYTGEITETDDRGQEIYSNGHGLANLYRGREENVERWFVRDDADSAWEPLLETDPLAFESPFRPVGYGTSLDRVFNIAWDPETEAWSLFRQDLTGGGNQLIFAHGALDIELVDTMGAHDRVVSAAFLDGRSRRAIVDRRVAEVFQYLSELLPELDAEIVDESWDQSIYLARVRASSTAGQFILVDMENEGVQSLAPEYDFLTDYLLSETTLVELESSTGGSIMAHLTLPVDVEFPVPAVILPRSRPSHEDVADPHYLAQFLSSSGYVVLRVNNRVEERYGRGWLPERTVAGWNQSADDIRDAADFLVENGFSEPGTICGAGKDYGAYAAMMSAIKYPDLFGCIVGIAAVTDPGETPGAQALRLTAGDEALAAASPVLRAAELDAPTLLFHGASDAAVSMAGHAVAMSDALGEAGKDVVFIEYPHATHAIERAHYRIDMLARMRGFLSERIGPPLTEEDEPIEQALRWRPD